MPHREDLIGLLRSLDRAMKESEPRAGHEARMRMRLAEGARSRAPVRTIALALCAVAAGAATWIGWSRSRSIEPSALPSGAPSASEVAAEPRAEPSSSARPSRPSPRRSAPALPLLPPHGELAPSPKDAAPTEGRSPGEPQRDGDRSGPPRGVRSFAASAGVEEGSPSRSRAGAQVRGEKAGFGLEWGASGTKGASAFAGEGARGPLTRMGTITGEPRSSGSPGAKTGDRAPSGSGATQGEQDVSKPGGEAASCEPFVLDFAGLCVSAVDLKEISAATCDDKGLALVGLDSPFDCEGAGATMAKITCCPPGASDAGEQDPMAACKPVSAGDGVTCLDVAILEEQAAAICTSWGMAFAKPAPSGVCGPKSATWLDAHCCLTQAPDSAPVPSGVVGDGATCESNDKLLDAANGACEAVSLPLLDFSPADDCEGDASTMAKYACGK